jgi:hypothetical protein
LHDIFLHRDDPIIIGGDFNLVRS